MQQCFGVNVHAKHKHDSWKHKKSNYIKLDLKMQVYQLKLHIVLQMQHMKLVSRVQGTQSVREMEM